MGIDDQRPRSVLIFSSGNPAATFLTAGLLDRHPAAIGTILIQGVGAATPAPEVTRTLAEIGIDAGARPVQLVGAPPAELVDVGLTICVPT
jgi:hypothetical protein